MRGFALLLTIILFSSSTFAQEKDDKENVKEAINKLLELAQTAPPKALAKHIVYRGSNRSRKWKDNCNFIKPEEKQQVISVYERLAKRYSPYKYEFVQFISEKESEGEWLVWEMKFITDSGPKKAYFAFLKVGKRYLLGDID